MATSRCYSEEWANKLYRGFKRNLTVPFRFVCFTDRERKFREPIEQMPLERRPITYGACVEPFKLDEAMIFTGLDTIVTGNCDKFAIWCLEHPGQLALPKHPFEEFSINGVVFCGKGLRRIYDTWDGQANDMAWMRAFPHRRIDELWPGKVVSYRGHVVKGCPMNKVRICYFHGRAKPHELTHLPWVRECWR